MEVTADDLLPLVAKLSPEERSRLLRLALAAGDAAAYEAVPSGPEEFTDVDDPLAWDAEGWDGLS